MSLDSINHLLCDNWLQSVLKKTPQYYTKNMYFKVGTCMSVKSNFFKNSRRNKSGIRNAEVLYKSIDNLY